MLAMLASQAMITILFLSVAAYSAFITDTLGYLANMLEQCFNSCGKQTYMRLPRNITGCLGAYIITLTARGVGHLISPGWLEDF